VGIRGGIAASGLAALLACGGSDAAVNLVHETTDLVRHNYFRLSPQASVVDGDGVLHVFARNSGLVVRHLEAGTWVEEGVDPFVGAGTDLSASIGDDGVMHVLYLATVPCADCTTPGFFTDQARHARRIDGTWQVTILSDELRESLTRSQVRALAAGEGGTLDVLGYGIANAAEGLLHSHFDGSTWDHEKLLDWGAPGATDLRVVGLARAPDDSLHGAVLETFSDGTERLIYFNKPSAGVWQSRVIREYSNYETVQIFIGISATDASTADIVVSLYDSIDHFHVTADDVDTFVIDNAGQDFIGRVTYPTLVSTPGQPLTAAFNVMANSSANNDWYQLWVATFNGASWSAEKIYGTGMAGTGTPAPSRVDPPQVHYAAGTLHVLNKETGGSWDLPGNVQPVSNWTRSLGVPGVWERSTVIESQSAPSVPGRQIAAAADAQGRIHALHFAENLPFFSMFDGGFLMYVAETGGSPVSERIPLDAGYLRGEGVAIALAADGTVHGMVEGSNYIRHVEREDGAWVVTNIMTPFYHVDGSRMAMTLDAEGHPHACIYQQVYVDSQEKTRLLHVSNTTGSWAIEPIATMEEAPIGLPMACAIRVLDDGVHVAYVDVAATLRKAVRISGAWSDLEVAPQSILTPRQQIAPMIDAEGFVHASFTRYQAFGPTYIPNGIGYGTNHGVVWTEELVDDDAQLGIEWDYFYRAEIEDHSPLYRSRLAQAPDGTLHVFYYDEGLYFARGAVRAGGAWRNLPVDLAQSSGQFGDVVALPDSTARYIYAVERSAAVRATTSIAGPALFLEGSLNFPQIVVGQSTTRSYSVVNRGAEALSLTSIAIYADSYALLPQGSTCAAGTVLEPGQSCSLAVEYEPAPFETQPTTSSERLGLLLIDSSDPWSAVGFRLEGLTAYPSDDAPGGGGGRLPLGISAALLIAALIRARRTPAAIL
jgi:hypothetical protein